MIPFNLKDFIHTHMGKMGMRYLRLRRGALFFFGNSIQRFLLYNVEAESTLIYHTRSRWRRGGILSFTHTPFGMFGCASLVFIFGLFFFSFSHIQMNQ